MPRLDELDADDISQAVQVLETRLKAEHAAEVKELNAHIDDIESQLGAAETRIDELKKLLNSMGTGWLEEYEKELSRLRGA